MVARAASLFSKVAYRTGLVLQAAALANAAPEGTAARAEHLRQMREHASAILEIGMPGARKKVVAKKRKRR